MSDLLQADIFFFISSIGFILVTACLLVVLYYAIHIARDVRAIVAKVRKAGDEIEGDFEALRATVRQEGAKGRAIIDLVLGFIARKLTPRTRKRSPQEPTSSEE